MRERERVKLSADPVRVCLTSHDRTPWIRNVGDSDVMLLIEPWPADCGVTLAPGCVVPLVNPRAATDSTPIYAVCHEGNSEIEYLYLT